MAKLQVTVRLDQDRLVRARKAPRAETVTENAYPLAFKVIFW